MVPEDAQIPHEIEKRLKAWRRWCFGAWLPRTFWVECESAESQHLGKVGNVWQGPAGLPGSARSALETVNDAEACEIEKALLRLPQKAALALRLHYVSLPAVPIKHKMRVLGLGHDAYFRYVADSAGALAAMLHWKI